MEERVLHILSLTTKIPEEELKTNMDSEKLWDSLVMLETVIALEDEFDITFSQEEISEMTTVAKICKIIKEKNEA